MRHLAYTASQQWLRLQDTRQVSDLSTRDHRWKISSNLIILVSNNNERCIRGLARMSLLHFNLIYLVLIDSIITFFHIFSISISIEIWKKIFIIPLYTYSLFQLAFHSLRQRRNWFIFPGTTRPVQLNHVQLAVASHVWRPRRWWTKSPTINGSVHRFSLGRFAIDFCKRVFATTTTYRVWVSFSLLFHRKQCLQTPSISSSIIDRRPRTTHRNKGWTRFLLNSRSNSRVQLANDPGAVGNHLPIRETEKKSAMRSPRSIRSLERPGCSFA